MDIINSPSPNFNVRQTDNIDMLIIHYTDTKDIFESLNILQNPQNEVSAHYLIAEDGLIYKLVEEEMRAWHAGLSYWDGVTDINSCSIGIELQNPGHTNGYRNFPSEQMHSLIILCQDIIKRHNIPAPRILGHSDIAPDRKQDPGYLFDWQLLAENGIGLWVENYNNGKNTNTNLKEKLIEFGYNPNISEEILLNAFRQHFIRNNNPDINAVISKLNELK